MDGVEWSKPLKINRGNCLACLKSRTSRKLICKNTAGMVPNLTNVKACMWKYNLTSESKGGTNFLSLSSSGSVHKNLWAQTPGLITRCSAFRLEHITAKIEFVSVYLGVLFMVEAGLGITQKAKGSLTVRGTVRRLSEHSRGFWEPDFWGGFVCASLCERHRSHPAEIYLFMYFNSVGSTLLSRLALQISVCFNL